MAFLVIAAVLILMHPGGKVAEQSLISKDAFADSRQSLAVQVNRSTVNRPAMAPRPARFAHARFVQHSGLRLADTGGSHADPIVKQSPQMTVPQMTAARYPYFGPEVTTKMTGADYSALSGLQMAHLDLLSGFEGGSMRDAAGTAPRARTIDIASTGKAFDFAAQIRQLHFQLPTAQ